MRAHSGNTYRLFLALSIFAVVVFAVVPDSFQNLSPYFLSASDAVRMTFRIVDPDEETEPSKQIVIDSEDDGTEPTAEESSASYSVFSDVPPTSPYFHYIQTLKNNGVVSGADGTVFMPERLTTRAETLKIAYNASNLTGTLPPELPSDILPAVSFSDVDENHSLYNYIMDAAKRGAVHGYPDDTFRPDLPPTYGEAVKILLNENSLRPGNEPYRPEPSLGLMRHVSYADEREFTKPLPRKFSISEPIPRQDIAVLTHQILHANGFEHSETSIAWYSSVIKHALESLRQATEVTLVAGHIESDIAASEVDFMLDAIDILRRNLELLRTDTGHPEG